MDDFAEATRVDHVRLSRAAQWRWLAIAAALMTTIVFAVVAIGQMIHREPLPRAQTPPGTFRPTPEQMTTWQTMRVDLEHSDARTFASGTIAVDGDQSTPVLMPFSGQVVKVMVDAGQRVRQGEPILLVRTNDFVDARTGLFAARAARQNAQAQLNAAERNAERQRQIYETAGGALKDYQQTKTDLGIAQAAVRTATAALSAARDKLGILGKSSVEIDGMENGREVAGTHSVTALRAPINGLVASRMVSVGQYVAQGGDRPVMTLTDPSRVWLIAQMPQGEVSSAHVGDSVAVTTPALPGRVFQAKIDLVGAALDPQTHRLPVRATIANPDGALKPQMFANFAIRRATAGSVMTVPAAAVIQEEGTARVWVVHPDRVLIARTVRTGLQQGGKIEITAGLRPGERIVTTGALFVNEAGLGS